MDSFKLEDEPHLTFSDALATSDDFVGTFERDRPILTLMEGYSGIIENEDAGTTYTIVALIDVTERARAQREEFARQLRGKDMLLKELQHRVKNSVLEGRDLVITIVTLHLGQIFRVIDSFQLTATPVN